MFVFGSRTNARPSNCVRIATTNAVAQNSVGRALMIAVKSAKISSNNHSMMQRNTNGYCTYTSCGPRIFFVTNFSTILGEMMQEKQPDVQPKDEGIRGPLKLKEGTWIPTKIVDKRGAGSPLMDGREGDVERTGLTEGRHTAQQKQVHGIIQAINNLWPQFSGT